MKLCSFYFRLSRSSCFRFRKKCEEVLRLRGQFCRKISSATTQHRGQRHVDCQQVRRDVNTGALVYSTDFTNTYYHPSPADIMPKNPVFDGRVHIDFSTYHSLDESQKEMLKEHGLIVNIVN